MLFGFNNGIRHYMLHGWGQIMFHLPAHYKAGDGLNVGGMVRQMVGLAQWFGVNKCLLGPCSTHPPTHHPSPTTPPDPPPDPAPL